MWYIFVINELLPTSNKFLHLTKRIRLCLVVKRLTCLKIAYVWFYLKGTNFREQKKVVFREY